jgi:hypothetical protein
MNAHTQLRLPPREALRVAILTRDEMATLSRQATEAAERARQLMFRAKLRAASLDRVYHEHHHLRVEALKAYAKDPAAHVATLPSAPADLPADLLTRERERNAAQQELSAADAAHEQLVKEVAAKAEALRQADVMVNRALKEVAIADAEALVAELNNLMERALPLRDELRALEDVVAPGEVWATGRLQLSRQIIDRLTTPLDWRPYLPGGKTYGDGQVERWTRYLERLQRDADAVRQA